MYILLILFQVFLGNNGINTPSKNNILTYEYDNYFDRLVIRLDTSNNTFVFDVYSCRRVQIEGTYKINGNKLKLRSTSHMKISRLKSFRFSDDKTQLTWKTRRHTAVYLLQESNINQSTE